MNPKLHNLADLQEIAALKAEKTGKWLKLQAQTEAALAAAETLRKENAALKRGWQIDVSDLKARVVELEAAWGYHDSIAMKCGSQEYFIKHSKKGERESGETVRVRSRRAPGSSPAAANPRADERPAYPAALYPHDVEHCSHPDCQAAWASMGKKERVWLRAHAKESYTFGSPNVYEKKED
jgi:hypothetical protein